MKEKKKDFSKGSKTVDGIVIPTETKEVVSANILSVTVGTNGYKGGDTGHGSRTYLCIEDMASTDMSCFVTGKSCGNAGKVELCFGGDSELRTLIDALEFAVSTLRKMENS